MADQPRIGSFKQEPKSTADVISAFVGKPNPSFEAAPVPASAMGQEPNALEQTELEVQQAIDTISKAPELTYEARLKKVGVTKAEAYQIIDDLLTKGYYEKVFPVTKRTNVTLRTREVHAQDAMQAALEETGPQYVGTVALVMSKANLARSLVRFGAQEFDPDKFNETMKYIDRLPYILFSLLCQKLSRFDTMVMTAMDEGALENF